jgi:hypothetical protein
MHDLETWLFICAALLATFVGVMWFVASRKRQIAADRGLICSICRYKPHDTEIEEIVETRHCPSCASEL